MRVLFTFLFICLVKFSFSQAVLFEANELFEEEQFYTAIPLYEKAYKRKQSYQSAERLGYCHLYLKDLKSAQPWFEKAIKFNEHDSKLNQVLGEIHKQKGEYDAAKLYYEAWAKEDKEKERIAMLHAKHCEEILAKKYPNGGFETQNLEMLNTKYDEFSPAWMNDRIVFSSDRMDWTNKKRINGQTGTPFLSMYSTSLVNNTITEPKPLWDDNIHQLHEGPKCFTDNGDIYYTSVDEESDIDSTVMPLNIYVGRLKGNSIIDKKAFEHNEKFFSDGHPYISRDGKRMYFISDRDKGYGGTDVYICYKNGETWSPPLNMGPAINSEFDERFPFERNEEELFFSSNRPSSLGGLDIYRSTKRDGLWQLAENMGEPLNSPRDDFGILFYPGTNNGIFSSTREGGLGNDDLYGFTYREELDFYKSSSPLASRNANSKKSPESKSLDNRLTKVDSPPSGMDAQSTDDKNKGATSDELGQFSPDELKDLYKSGKIREDDFKRKDDDISGTLEVRNMQLIKDEEDSSLYVTGQIVEILDNGSIIPAKETEVIVYNKITAQPAIAETDKYGQFVLKGSQRISEPNEKPKTISSPKEGFDIAGKPKGVNNTKPDGTKDPLTEGVLGYDDKGQKVYDSPSRVGRPEKPANYAPNAIYGYDVNGNPIFKTKEAQNVYFTSAGKPKYPNESSIPPFSVYGYPQALNPSRQAARSDIRPDFIINPTKKEYYNLRANKQGYFSKGVDFTTDPLASKVTVTGEQDVLININYDFDDFRLTKEAIRILDEVILFLRKHEELDVILRSYTDLRGSAAYNQSLSEKRANAVKSYLILNGINRSRLVSYGEGEKNPILRNAETEEQHRVNRRTEFELIERR